MRRLLERLLITGIKAATRGIDALAHTIRTVTRHGCEVCGNDTAYARTTNPDDSDRFCPVHAPLELTCIHGLYVSRCERCGAEPLNADAGYS
jgi:hypothetical protein